MGKTNPFRPETYVERPVLVVPAANATYDVDLPAGAYRLSAAVKSSVTGTTTSVKFIPYVDAARSQVSNQMFRVFEADDAVAVTNITLPAGAAGRFAHLQPAVSSVNAGGPIVLPHGLQVTVTKGGATTGEACVVDICAARVG